MRRQATIAAAGPSLLLIAALVPDLRPAVALGMGAGWVLLAATRQPAAIAWAAALPVAVSLVWPWVLGADAPLGPEACIAPWSAIALRRIAIAVAVLALVGLLARVHASPRVELGLRRPGRGEVVLAVAGCVALAAAGLWIGPAVARPFFGALEFAVPPAALLPAVGFGIANGLLEEVAYRGALQAWLGRLVPVGAAVAFQGLVFGIVHAGPEVVALLPVHVGLLMVVGVAGGFLVARTGSLAIPIGLHVGADIALYVGLACRSPG